MSQKSISLVELLARGDAISMEEGCLLIRPKSGREVPDKWMRGREINLVVQMLKLTEKSGFRFLYHTTGRYMGGLAAGVTLHFSDLLTGEDARVTFNADLDRARDSKNGKRGDPLPMGQFRVQQGSKFVSFWTRSGVNSPSRLSSFHEHMGNLKKVVFTGSVDCKKRLHKGDLKPLNISYQEVLKSSRITPFPDKPPTSPQQITDNALTVGTDKETPPYENWQGVPKDSGACSDRYGQRIIGETDSAKTISPSDQDSPTKQTIENWGRAYDSRVPFED